MKPENLFYSLSLIFFIGWWIVAGIKQREDLLSWIAGGGLIIMAVISGAEIQLWIESFFYPEIDKGSQSAPVGALTGGFVAFLLLRKLLNWNENVFEIIVLPFLISAAIIFVGCYDDGNCFGIVTSLPWGIQFDKGTAAHTWQVTTERLSFAAEKSLPVHPVELYKVTACIFASCIFFLVKRRSQLKGIKLFGVSILFFFSMLFFFSFFEQEINSGMHRILTCKQYFLIGGIISCVFVAGSKINLNSQEERKKTRRFRKGIVIGYCLAGALVMFFATWPDLLVIVLIQAVLLAVLVVERIRALRGMERAEELDRLCQS